MHITKISLFRKLSIISLAVLVFFTSLLGSTANTANAIGFDTAVKIAAGSSAKQVVRAIGEKAGLALSGKQLDNVVSVINKKAADGDSKALDFVERSKNATGTAIAEKPGWKKYLLDPMLWLTGLDLILLAVNGFQDAFDSGTSIAGKCYVDVTGYMRYDGKPMFKISGGSVPISDVMSSGTGLTYSMTSSYTPWNIVVDSVVYENPNAGYNYDAILVINFSTYSKDGYYNSKQYRTTSMYISGTTDRVKTQHLNESNCSFVPAASDVPDITNVNNNVYNTVTNNNYDVNNITYNLDVELPDNLYDNSVTVWNQPDPALEQVLAPKPDEDNDGIPDEEEADSDGDGVSDDKDSDAEKGGWLENLLPIVTLIIIFDLLKAVIFYLARMFEFILTIPLIESKPINNVAFEWFRTAEIVGIEIYSVISLLATVGLSFAVYKVVRRLLP